MPNRPKAYTRHQSRLDPITAVKYYALIGVNEKLSNLPPNHRPAYTGCSNIVCVVVLSCFILPAKLFMVVKIDDRYPDKCNN